MHANVSVRSTVIEAAAAQLAVASRSSHPQPSTSTGVTRRWPHSGTTRSHGLACRRRHRCTLELCSDVSGNSNIFALLPSHTVYVRVRNVFDDWLLVAHPPLRPGGTGILHGGNYRISPLVPCELPSRLEISVSSHYHAPITTHTQLSRKDDPD